MKIVINGISGKMGAFLYDYLKEKNEYEVVAGISRQNLDLGIPIHPEFKTCLENEQFDTLIDFSIYPFCLDIIKKAILNQINVVSGTTGYKKYDVQHLKYLAKKNQVGIIISPNFSLVNKEMSELIVQIKNILPNVEIIEEHNIHKKDKPSGTAKYFGKLLNVDREHIHSVRLPGIIANHHLLFADNNQSIFLTHKINNRQAFINGIEHAIIEVTNYKTIEILI
ncbi:dihydrodipicolinate reductase [Mycoplasmatota bacterium]|nr:dihydrodipicolinate reductase [Mycoplasmatota bacterium]